MNRTLQIHPTNPLLTKEDVQSLINQFDSLDGGIDKRNVIKIVEKKGIKVNIKSFKVPHIVNKIAYGIIRDSKAKRSFDYAIKLAQLEINTPMPIAYMENRRAGMLFDSYYLSEHLNYDFTIRELVDDSNFDDYESIMRAFTRFTFTLHEKGINFLDHSPGNTLILNKDSEYEFYLVDLNRMNFEPMDFNKRMKNFARLSPKDKMLEILSDEYAKHYKQYTFEEIKEKMSFYSNQFSTAYKKKERFKRKYFFWRKKKK